MKGLRIVLAVIAVVFSLEAAASLNGSYTFTSRTKNGKADMAGWTGTMQIKKDTMTRHYNSADGKTKKFYVGTMKKDGDAYLITFTDAYKKEYIGDAHRNTLTLAKNTLIIESADGNFKEVWTKK